MFGRNSKLAKKECTEPQDVPKMRDTLPFTTKTEDGTND